MRGDTSLLIIEDSSDDRYLYRRLLAKYQEPFSSIEEVESAEEALEILQHHRPICCLLDYQLPGMDGLTFLRKLKKLWIDDMIPVVVLTGQGDESIAVQLMRNGAHDYLVKGDLTAESLHRAIGNAVRTCSLQHQLNYMAHFDALTGLLNRALFLDRLQLAIKKAERNSYECSLFYLDLDHFKPVNDSLGHDAGDALLQAVAGRIKSVVRETDSVARIGGDEFVVLLENVDVNITRNVAEKLLEEVNRPTHIAEHEVAVSSSIGIARYPTTAKSAQELLKHADLALYAAKGRGRSTYHEFSQSQKEIWQRKQALEAALPKAIAKGELQPYFQPIVDIPGERLRGFELLSRWPMSDYPNIQAMELIQMVEGLGLMEPFNEWLIDEVCGKAVLWTKEFPDISLSINMPANQFHNTYLVDMFRSKLSRYPIDPSVIELEITETTLMRQPDASIRLLNSLHELGLRIAVDDFGTGYSSLAYLTRLPIDILKIDKCFFLEAQHDERNKKVIETVVALGHHLGLKVTAEGIESDKQWNDAKKSRCDLAQGYLFGRPTPCGSQSLKEFMEHFPRIQRKG
ncbi:predicted signal transduction protein containing a membrane domain, an EAL and a GGDEF domain [Hahella chejuensis KCTC 2396]|uniref:Predicted signal transduction protein containing a membrane domain, an EAL and a GGDEF domain n=1 Tax=Hahella chejuensis (strain KCTC 2396) TaxID=349521 RepID=Q2SEI0_HAHCH|nr:GGDEF domain-containing response regulator [Hahella chejuensis]ABC30944.1 predicted signal transduction protein containing a membrane domain, an EAL and a GGDEF domain [Hahella chejuensis KCTC 2396]